MLLALFRKVQLFEHLLVLIPEVSDAMRANGMPFTVQAAVMMFLVDSCQGVESTVCDGAAPEGTDLVLI